MKIEYTADPGPQSTWLIGAAMPVPNQDAGSDCMRYVVQKGPEPGAAAADTIGGMVVPVVLTAYTVRGPNGQDIQQLRERYALSLGTATRGMFSEADPTASDGWKLQRSFRIARIVQP